MDQARPMVTGRRAQGDALNNIESQRTVISNQQAAVDYPMLQRRYAATEPLFIMWMCSSFANILSVAVTSEALVAEVNNHVARDWEGRTSESDPTRPLWSPP
jgi:hypothetical protein